MGQSLPTLVRSGPIALLSAGVLFSCQKGLAQEAGEKVDDAIDKLTGKAPGKEPESESPSNPRGKAACS